MSKVGGGEKEKRCKQKKKKESNRSRTNTQGVEMLGGVKREDSVVIEVW